jgi:hypothetical protein
VSHPRERGRLRPRRRRTLAFGVSGKLADDVLVLYDREPDGQVFQPAGGEGDHTARKRYDITPYEHYESSDAFGSYGIRGTGEPRSWNREALDIRTVVPGIEVGDDAVGYPQPRVADVDGIPSVAVGCSSVSWPMNSTRTSTLDSRSGRPTNQASSAGRDPVGRRDRSQRRRPSARTAADPPVVRLRAAGRPRTGLAPRPSRRSVAVT